MNRIYGIEKDRPFAEKYKRAFLLAVSAGAVLAVAFALLAFGRGLVDEGVLRTFWLVVRWPVGIGLVAAGLAVLFRWAPKRRQPGWAWLAFGAGVGVAAWTLTTVFSRSCSISRRRRADVRIARRARRLAAVDGVLGVRDPVRIAARPSSRPYARACRRRRTSRRTSDVRPAGDAQRSSCVTGRRRCVRQRRRPGDAEHRGDVLDARRLGDTLDEGIRMLRAVDGAAQRGDTLLDAKLHVAREISA